MSNRVIIGSVAVAAAGYLVYQRQVQLKQQQTVPVSPVTVHDQNTFERTGAKTGAKLDDVANDVKDKVSQYKTETDYKFQDIASQVEGKKAGIADWAAEKLDNAKSSVEQTRDRYQETEENLKGNLEAFNNKDKPNAVVQAINTTKDSISTDLDNIKEGFIDDLKSVKTAIVGTGNQLQDEVRDGTNELANKSSEQFANAKDSLSQAAASSTQTVNKAAQNVKDTSANILNWGFNNAEKARALAINKYDEANKKYEELNEQLKQSRKGFFDKGDAELQKKVDDAKSYVNSCKQKLA